MLIIVRVNRMTDGPPGTEFWRATSLLEAKQAPGPAREMRVMNGPIVQAKAPIGARRPLPWLA